MPSAHELHAALCAAPTKKKRRAWTRQLSSSAPCVDALYAAQASTCAPSGCAAPAACAGAGALSISASAAASAAASHAGCSAAGAGAGAGVSPGADRAAISALAAASHAGSCAAGAGAGESAPADARTGVNAGASCGAGTAPAPGQWLLCFVGSKCRCVVLITWGEMT